MKNFTRNIVLSIALCFALTSADAQFVTIPDPNFVTWLNTHGYASCMSGNQMDTTCSAVVNATSVNCMFSSISNLSGIRYFDHLIQLNCAQNQLTSLPVLPSTLARLSCESNQIIFLPVLPAALTELHCDYNQITSITSIPATVRNFSCKHNQLNSLPPLPASLSIFWCSNNSLISLPALPPTLTNLICDSNQLTSLPALPALLTEMHCDHNSLVYLPSLPAALTKLYCSQNQLISLPSLPSSLTLIQCYVNNLTSLPSLPASLYQLECFFNNLTSLPALPSSLRMLICGFNQLTSLPTLPDTMDFLYINDNTGLTCLTPIHKVSYLLWVNTGISCLPNPVSVISATPSISNLPICAGYNPASITVSGGAAKVCPGDTRNYTTPLVLGAAYYWTAPTGSVINSGQGTRTVNVTYNSGFTSNGVISVSIVQGCKMSAPKTLTVSRNIPSTPSAITGTTYGLCGATNKVYSVTQVAGMTYQWTVPAVANIVNGQGTNSITVNFPSSNFTGTVSVKAVNACGAGAARNLTVRAIPSTPLPITGPATACANQTGVAYSTAPIATVISYTWGVPSGASITSGQGTNSIVMKYGTSGGNVKVRAFNACGGSSYKNLAVTINCRQDISSIENTFDISIYPNPSNNYFSINITSAGQSDYQLVLKDVLGRSIKSWNNLKTGEVFDFGYEFSNGIYFAEILQGDNRKIMRVIKSE